MITDTERIEFLQEMLNRRMYTGRCILRHSISGRGWRLHESSKATAVPTVRQAIDNFMRVEKMVGDQKR